MIRFNASGIFKLIWMGAGVVGFIMSQSYSERARMIPMWLSIFVIIIMFLLFLQENVPALGKYLGFMGQSGLFAEQETESERSEQSSKDKEEYRKLFQLVIWLVAFTVVLAFVTYLIAVPLFLLLFIKFEGKQNWRTAIYVAAGMGIFNYVLFDILLKSTL